jgi:hypothetical protein
VSKLFELRVREQLGVDILGDDHAGRRIVAKLLVEIEAQ